jgi:hypothetical protein
MSKAVAQSIARRAIAAFREGRFTRRKAWVVAGHQPATNASYAQLWRLPKNQFGSRVALREERAPEFPPHPASRMPALAQKRMLFVRRRQADGEQADGGRRQAAWRHPSPMQKGKPTGTKMEPVESTPEMSVTRRHGQPCTHLALNFGPERVCTHLALATFLHAICTGFSARHCA